MHLCVVVHKKNQQGVVVSQLNAMQVAENECGCNPVNGCTSMPRGAQHQCYFYYKSRLLDRLPHNKRSCICLPRETQHQCYFY